MNGIGRQELYGVPGLTHVAGGRLQLDMSVEGFSDGCAALAGGLGKRGKVVW